MPKIYKYILKRVLFVLVISFLVNQNASASDYGNEWIVDGQVYVKFKTAKNGMYRVDYNQLFSVLGTQLTSLNPDKMQLYFRGNEHAIYYHNVNSTSEFDSGDYIEFYGQKNNGELDALLYENPEERANPYYNLYSDTTAYFLTWGISNGKRIEVEVPVNAVTQVAYHFNEQDIVFDEVYSIGKFNRPSGTNAFFSESWWKAGEGWHSFWMREGRSKSHLFTGLSNVYNGGVEGSFTVALATFFDGVYTNELELGSTNIQNFSLPDKINAGFLEETVSMNPSAIDASGNLLANLKSISSPEIGTEGVSYMKVRYPQLLDMENQLSKLFILPNEYSGNVVMSIDNVPSSSWVYKITNEANIQLVPSSILTNTLTLKVKTISSEQKLLVRDTSDYIIPDLEEVEFSINDEVGDPNYIMVSHKKFWSEALEYQVYRDQKYTTLLADIDRLYNQYSYGEKSSLAIYRFCKYLYDNTSSKPEYLFLMGKSINIGYMDLTKYPQHTTRRIPDLLGSEILDYIPTAGTPPSDALYTMGLNPSEPDMPAFAVGRIAVTQPEQIIAYLSKVKEHEAQSYQQEWKKNILHLSGGQSSSEANEFSDYLESYESKVEGQYYGANVTTYKKTTTDPVEYVNLADDFNNGVQMLTVFGHSSPSFNDIEIGEVSNPDNGYENKGKYPLIFVNGCQWGDIFGSPRLAEDWVNTADKGAIATLASSGPGIPFYLNNQAQYLFTRGFQNQNFINESIGKIHQETIRYFYTQFTKGFDIYADATVMQMILQGDPAVKLFDVDGYDLAILENSIQTSSSGDENILISDDTVQFLIPVINYGLAYDDSTYLLIEKVIDSDTILIDSLNFQAVYNRDTLIINSINHLLEFGVNDYVVTVGSHASLDDKDITNNSIAVSVLASDDGFTLLSPELNDTINDTIISFIAQTNDLTVIDTSYTLELDTSLLFLSPSLLSVEVRSGITPIWSDVILPVIKHKTNYYWRFNYTGVSSTGSDTGSFIFMYEEQIADFTISNINDTNLIENQVYISNDPVISGDSPVGSLTYSLAGVDISNFTVNPSTGVVNMAARDYENPVDSDLGNTYQFTLIATDELGNVASKPLIITITDSVELANFTLNEIPDTSISENLLYDGLTPSLSGDAFIGSLTYSLAGLDSLLFTIDSLTGTVSLNTKDFEIPIDNDLNNNYEVSIIAIDDDGNRAIESWVVSITDLIETANFMIAPVLDTVTNENEIHTFAINLSGDTPIGIVKYELSGGEDSTLFDIDTSTGLVTFTAQDFENPLDVSMDNQYNVRIKATDNDGNLDEEELSIYINDVFESATFVINLTSDTSINENVIYTGVTPSLTGDTPIGNINYSISGPDISFFTIDSITGVLSLPAQDFENPVDFNGDNTYELVITATDSDGNTDNESFKLSINNVNDGDFDVMEASINTSISNISQLTTGGLFQGDTLSFTLAFQYSYGEGGTDALLANYLVVNNSGNFVDTTLNLGSFNENDTSYLSVSLPTKDFAGTNTITIEFNPDTSFFEDTYVNNIYFTSFDVREDLVSPILDVTFDGSHIFDGDILGTNPEIIITLEDENSKLLKSDLEGMIVQIKPDSCLHIDGLKDCYNTIDSSELTVIPATINSNYQLTYQSDTLEKGDYTLRVFAEDAAGNEIPNPYEISFSIIKSATAISEVMVYPNPCESNCTFSMVVQGEQYSDENFIIQLSDITGKVVKEIDVDISELNTGWNNISLDVSTAIAGNPMEQGLYFYRIVTSDKLDSFSEATFKEREVLGYTGRLYIVR